MQDLGGREEESSPPRPAMCMRTPRGGSGPPSQTLRARPYPTSTHRSSRWIIATPLKRGLTALRWLRRWGDAAPGGTIERAAEVAAQLADLPAEPSALEEIREVS